MTEELIELLKSNGAALVGFADLMEIDPNRREEMRYAVSIAVALDPYIIADIWNGPNVPYLNEYRRANDLLDELGRKAAAWLEANGHRAKHLPATNSEVDWQALTTVLPHKIAATRSGLGWLGKNALLVTKEFGSAIRLTTVLTDLKLSTGDPVDTSSCGECVECLNACPGKAVTGANWSAGVERDEIYDAFSCLQIARNFRKQDPAIEDNICGICIVACPWTQRYLERTLRTRSV